MNHGFARIAAVSLRVRLGNVEENEAQILAATKRLEAQGVQAAVFPELCSRAIPWGICSSILVALVWRPWSAGHRHGAMAVAGRP